MFFDVLIVFILFVLAPLSVFWGIKMMRESKPSTGSQSSVSEGTGMRRSELEAMIRDAVIQETARLEARVDELEQELLLGEGRLDASTLAEAFDDDLAPKAESLGSQARNRA